MNFFKIIMKDNKGQGIIEYALIAALIAVIAVAVITILGDQIISLFQSTAK
ncbi:MAG: Flp family type IVb pilin [Candidatus Margulisbacteria bacterium]|nr:Flp family type IVb pilin [Candidatus Margulisiibacteriota bacterium]